MEKVPTLREVSIQLQSTTADIRLKNAQLAGVIEYLDAGYEPHVHDFCLNRAKFLDHRLLSLKDDLRNLEFNIKEYVSKLGEARLRVPKGGPHPSSKTDSGIGMPPDTSRFSLCQKKEGNDVGDGDL